MAKRRAEDTLLHDSPSKRCYRSLRSVDMQLESFPPTGGVSLSPPSLLALLGSRCRKRPYYFEDPEQKQEEAAGLYRKTTQVADGDTNTEDCTYNSFQYWRVPLPELDLSLLEDVDSHSQTKQKSDVKDSSSDAMET
uniref:Putative WW-binding domain-containing protein n=1 Tax=Lates calcarifer TaxID=8187 RepID=A0A4W6FTV7_LATCA